MDIPTEVLKQICDFDNKNTYAVLKGKVMRQTAGCPMGGFLSPFKAIAGCCISEYQIIKAQREKDCDLIQFTARYMDDVLTVVPYESNAELDAAKEWMESIRAGYPKPLVLEVNELGDQQRFLELMIETVGSEITCRLFNRVTDALLQGKSHHQRLPVYGDNSVKRVLLSTTFGAFARIKQGSSSLGLACSACRELRTEMVASGHMAIFTAVMRILEARERESVDDGSGDDDRWFWTVVGAFV